MEKEAAEDDRRNAEGEGDRVRGKLNISKRVEHWVAELNLIKPKVRKQMPVSFLTMGVDEQGQIFPVERVDVEQQSRTLTGPEAQGDVFSSQRQIGVDGGRRGAAVSAQFIGLLEVVGDGC